MPREATSDSIYLAENELYSFRTLLCLRQTQGTCSNPDWCPQSHCLTWQRRNPMKYVYLPSMCPEIEFIRKQNRMQLVRKCNKGRHCCYAHSKEEELYHPMMYKKKLCKSASKCARRFCPFAHSYREVGFPVTLEDYFSKVSTHWIKLNVNRPDLIQAGQLCRGIRESLLDAQKRLHSTMQNSQTHEIQQFGKRNNTCATPIPRIKQDDRSISISTELNACAPKSGSSDRSVDDTLQTACHARKEANGNKSRTASWRPKNKASSIPDMSTDVVQARTHHQLECVSPRTDQSFTTEPSTFSCPLPFESYDDGFLSKAFMSGASSYVSKSCFTDDFLGNSYSNGIFDTFGTSRVSDLASDPNNRNLLNMQSNRVCPCTGKDGNNSVNSTAIDGEYNDFWNEIDKLIANEAATNGVTNHSTA